MLLFSSGSFSASAMSNSKWQRS